MILLTSFNPHSFAGRFRSRLYALKRSRPRRTLSRFIPAIPKSASGSSTPFLNFGASTMSLYVIRMWHPSLAVKNVTQLSAHSTLTHLLLFALRNPAIRRTFLVWRKMECSCKIPETDINDWIGPDMHVLEIVVIAFLENKRMRMYSWHKCIGI